MAFLIYLAQLSLYAAIMWSIYYAIWRNRPLHFYSRVYLLASLILPALLPLVHLPASNQFVAATYQIALPELTVNTGHLDSKTADFSWPQAIMCCYAVGCLLFAAANLLAYSRINSMLRKGIAINYAGRQIIVDTGIGPGILGRQIFFPAAEIDEVIVSHELAHIKAGHRYDALLIQLMRCIFWPSPAHWLIGSELKTVHEFEADRIAGKNVAAEDYAALLLSQSFGSNRTFPIAYSFFHHPLKRRIMMLQRTNALKSKTLLLSASIVLTAVLICTALIGQTKRPERPGTGRQPDKSAVKEYVPYWKVIRPKAGEVKTLSNGTIAFSMVEEMPRFNGELYKWVAQHLRYPESLRKDGIEGKCVMQFTISADGKLVAPRLSQSSGNPLLDQEAMRLVSEMPDWIPGKHHGSPVSVLLTLPIRFGSNGNEGC